MKKIKKINKKKKSKKKRKVLSYASMNEYYRDQLTRWN